MSPMAFVEGELGKRDSKLSRALEPYRINLPENLGN